MGSFGYFSSILEPDSYWNNLTRWLPDRLRYRKGPLRTGTITGVISGEVISGWGWKIPENNLGIWSPEQTNLLWSQVENELRKKEITIIGIDPASSFLPPVQQIRGPLLPGISDGKTLELLFFLNYFRKILRTYEICASKAKAVIVWEEGNLGVACARLIAGDVRFLTLIHPHLHKLEQAAEIVFAESGISPQIYTELPQDFKGSKIIIRCGKLIKYNTQITASRIIKCELFKNYPTLSMLNSKIPLEAKCNSGNLPFYPVLGETIIREAFGLQKGIWFGTELTLERVNQLARALKALGFPNFL